MRLLLALRALFFVLLLPGTVAGYIPFSILRADNLLRVPGLGLASVCAALPERGLGVAIKIDDGNNARAAEVAMAAAIEAYVSLDDGAAELMRSLSDLTLRNWNGIEVGALRASDELRRLGKAS